MTFDEVRTLSLPAFLRIEGGAVLHYDPRDGCVRRLAFPTRPNAWQRAPFHEGEVPDTGWCHLPACGCSACATLRGDCPSSATPQRAQRGRGTSR